jgi:hypothetical protein
VSESIIDHEIVCLRISELQLELQNNSHLEEIHLSSNSMGSEGARDLGVALKSN